MKKLIFALLLSLNLAHAKEGWIQISEGELHDTYADISNYQRSGNRVKMWFLNSLKNQTNGYLSLRSLQEFDCKKKQSRVLQLSTHSGRMATGKTLSVDHSIDDWQFVAPGTQGELVLDFACS